ncbi:hypothetical protein LJC22_04640 [Desulfosarcina sp. OttesenSCG-928-G10]|nr:hypothetical protein [Desulfosarcina sp. OttesenSCG-928-G10]
MSSYRERLQLNCIDQIRFKMDNGSENSEIRSQFLYKMLELTDSTGKTVHILYYLPCHSKYNIIERCW